MARSRYGDRVSHNQGENDCSRYIKKEQDRTEFKRLWQKWYREEDARVQLAKIIPFDQFHMKWEYIFETVISN